MSRGTVKVLSDSGSAAAGAMVGIARVGSSWPDIRELLKLQASIRIMITINGNKREDLVIKHPFKKFRFTVSIGEILIPTTRLF